MNRLALLGPIQVTRDNEPVRGFESRKALGLLCYLAVRSTQNQSHQPVSRVELANLFWGDKTETQGRGNLSRVLNNLSTLFPNSFLTDRESVQVKPDAFSLDVAEFETLRAAGTPESLASVVPLYRGEFMAGIYLDDCPDFEIWLVQERERWQQRIVSVLECLGGYHARRGEFATALPFAARLLEIEPWREETHRHMMQLLAQTNQRSAALQQYENARRVLQEELGVEPSAETNALYEKIRAQEIAPPKTPPHNLPTHLTTFFGRETELTRIAARLNNPDCRLLTLVGAGGMGKTRLAIQAAKNVLNSFRDGVYFVPLASIGAGQTQFIVPAIANALNLSLTGQQEPKAQVLNFLREKELLLLLDNFEHLLAGAEFVVEILQNAPNVKILATSREPLDVQAEWITRVDGLSFPSAAPRKLDELIGFSATRLFVERAQRANDEFELNQESAPHIIRLTQIVEGMPLALELAAARTRTMRVNEIRVQVEASFDFLATTMRDVDARHKSLRAVLEWSYGALSKQEQELFARVSVFAGGWTTEAAEAVCTGDDIEENQVSILLSELVEKSLVLKEEPAGETRCRMLEPIRQYARERLSDAGESEVTAARHLSYFIELGEKAAPQLRGAQQGVWLRRLDGEHANLRAALNWHADGQAHAEQRLRLAAALGYFWQVRGIFDEGEKFLQEVLQESEPVATPTRAKAFVSLGTIYWLRGDYDKAVAPLEQALALYRKLDDGQGIAHTLYQSGVPHFYTGRFHLTLPLWEESLERARNQGDTLWTALMLSALAELARYRGDYTRARALNEEAHALATQVQHIQHIALALNNLGLLATLEGDYARAVKLFRESLATYRTAGEQRHVPECLDGLAAALNELGQPETAALLIGAADAFRESIGMQVTPIDRPDYERLIARVREKLQDDFQIVWEKGRAMTLEQAIEFALDGKEPKAV